MPPVKWVYNVPERGGARFDYHSPTDMDPLLAGHPLEPTDPVERRLLAEQILDRTDPHWKDQFIKWRESTGHIKRRD
jgi:hypothetical protein